VFRNIKGKAVKHASSVCSRAECFIHGVIHVIEETIVTSGFNRALVVVSSLLEEVEPANISLLEINKYYGWLNMACFDFVVLFLFLIISLCI
jgi:hypothetical protein